MGTAFTFHDYVDEAGNNAIRDWLHRHGSKVTADFNNKILHMEATPKGLWHRPTYDDLKRDCEGLFEIRGQRFRTQLRILGFFHPGKEKDATLLLGFEKAGEFLRKYPCTEAFRRRAIVLSNTEKFRKPHDLQPPTRNTEEP